MNVALLLIRLVVGGLVAAHSAQKVFRWFGGHGLHGTAGYVQSLGFRPGRPYALLLGGAELVGGVALAAGFLTLLAAAAVAGVMLAAIAVVHWDKGPFISEGGWEHALTVGVAAIATAFSGGGRWSLDHAFGWTLGSEAWGVVALVIAAAAATVVVGSRHLRAHRPSRRPLTA